MAQQLIDRGLSPGDGNGEDGYSAFGKVNANFTELYAMSTGGTLLGYVATSLATGTYNDFTPGGAFPLLINRMDINPTTGDVHLTGMVAGVDGQQMLVRNIGATNSVFLDNESAGSSPANRFDGEGDAGIPPGARQYCVYYTSPIPRWSIG